MKHSGLLTENDGVSRQGYCNACWIFCIFWYAEFSVPSFYIGAILGFCDGISCFAGVSVFLHTAAVSAAWYFRSFSGYWKCCVQRDV